MGPLSRKIQCQIIEVQKLGIKKNQPTLFYFKKLQHFFCLEIHHDLKIYKIWFGLDWTRQN
jgi:hypothetical protein